MPRVAVLITLLVALVVAACGGQSKEQKATSQVCNARDSIAKQVDTLSGLTLSTASLSQIQSSLKTIGDDLKTIANAQGDLNSQRKAQVQQANQKFTSQIQSIASSLGSSTSLSQAKGQVQTALQQLADSYKKTFALVDCSNG